MTEHIESYLFRFKKHGQSDKSYFLDVWKILNYIKTNTNRHKQGQEFGETCKLAHKLYKEECLE